MPRLKFHREFSHPLDRTGRRKTWPAEWEGHVEDEAIAEKAVKEGHAVLVGAPAPRPAPPPVEIPADWRALSAPDMIALAHKLGAGGEVAKKDDAAAYIEKIAAERQQTLV
jgi:hypothetical protein